MNEEEFDDKIFDISEKLADEVYDHVHYSERQELAVRFYKILKEELSDLI